MNTAIKDAALELEQALKTVPGNYNRDPGAEVDPPGFVLGPPALTWETGCSSPTSARFIVFVVVPADDYAVDRLWTLVTAVGEAIDEHTRGVVVRADPSAFPAGTTDLPAYEIQVEFPLEAT